MRPCGLSMNTRMPRLPRMAYSAALPVSPLVAPRMLSCAPQTVSDNAVQVALSEAIPDRAALCASDIWQEYDERCIACGRCTLVCPSCTCFTMQDLFYDDAGRIGERRRVQASCMIDGYTDVAGGGSYRQGNGARMRFKVLHAVDRKSVV